MCALCVMNCHGQCYLKVNGKNENPIYTFLKSRCPSVRKEFQAPYKLYYDPYHQDDIRYFILIYLFVYLV